MKNIFIILLLLSSLSATAQNCQFQTVVPNVTFNQCDSNPWALIFSDEFNGSTLDFSKWRPINGVPRDLDFTGQKAWHKPENVEVSNGTLKIVSKAEVSSNMPVVTNWNPYTVKYENFDYSTAEIWSNDNFSFGKYEARIKVPNGVGLWPAFWLFGGPTWNEIDIFEFYGDTPNDISMTSHYNGNMCGSSANSNHSDGNYHIYTLIYGKDMIEWFVDGELKRRMHRYYFINGQEIGCTVNGFTQYIMNKSFPKDPMAIVLNTAIQSGNKAPNASTIFPTQMEVDWVRYYEHKSCQSFLINSPNQINITNSYNSLVGIDITVNSPTLIEINNQYSMIAKNSISLKPNFSIKSGANFNAKIDPLICTNTYRTSAIENSDEDDYIKSDLMSLQEIENLAKLVKTSNEISVYPNPTNKSFSLSLKFSETRNTTMKIYTVTGNEVYSSSLGELNYFKENFDLNLVDGIYLIKIIHGEEEFQEKIIISQ